MRYFRIMNIKINEYLPLLGTLKRSTAVVRGQVYVERRADGTGVLTTCRVVVRGGTPHMRVEWRAGTPTALTEGAGVSVEVDESYIDAYLTSLAESTDKPVLEVTP